MVSITYFFVSFSCIFVTMKYFFWLISFTIAVTGSAQQTQTVDFKKANASIALNPENKSVEGKVVYTFQILKKTDSIFLDAKNMEFSFENQDSGIELKSTSEKLWMLHSFKAGKIYKIQFSYTANPEQTMYFVGWENTGSNQIWTQGQGKKTSHWLPSIDDLNEKIEFDLSIVAPRKYRAISNGKLLGVEKVSDTTARWNFDMNHPMSSYLVALAVGDFENKTIFSESGVPIKLFYEPKDSAKVEPTYRYTKQIFDFLETEIGVPFPWQNHKQVPVRDFLYAGMENTTLTIFSEAFVIDSTAFIDRNYVNVNAHELAHQWFGDLVTEVSSEHHWLQEGFATYYALLAEREIFGNDYYYFKLFKTAEQLKARSDKGEGESLLDPKANSLTFYQKGAWALVLLREKIGEEAFREAVKNYLRNNAYQNARVSDFISEAEKSSGQDLTEFVENWLQQTAFQADQAMDYLKESRFMVDYLNLAALRTVNFQEKKMALSEVLDFSVNDYLGQEVIFQLAQEIYSPEVGSLYKKAFVSNNLLTRQAIANLLTKIPQGLKSEYETLLLDDSYLTQEKALLHLWTNFPKNRAEYMEALKLTEGFPDKNVELLWLTLNLATKNYEPEKKQENYAVLSQYTLPKYGFPIRQNAFGYLYQLNAFSNQNYKDLLQGCFHQTWRFRDFCRKLLEELLKDESHREKLMGIKNGLSPQQVELLTKKLN